MKTRILFLGAAFLAIFLAGCVKSPTQVPAILPTGNFIGTFTRLHFNSSTNKVDTVTATLTLTMSASTGYAVGGDTSKHAGSHGSYVTDATGTYIAFSDVTLPSTNVANAPAPTKTHLNGVYQYAFSQGVGLQLQAVGDTLAYFYNMKAQ